MAEKKEDLEISTSWKIGKITEELKKFLQEKNVRYGDSAVNPLNIFSVHENTGIGQRLDDKLSRIKNAKELRKNDVVDMMGYLVLLCAKNNWITFQDLID
jgi:hypothetical protein